MNPEAEIDILRARLNAHRRILVWLANALPPDAKSQLAQALRESLLPQDGQEDPGAVPAAGFGELAEQTAETRAILSALRDVA